MKNMIKKLFFAVFCAGSCMAGGLELASIEGWREVKDLKERTRIADEWLDAARDSLLLRGDLRREGLGEALNLASDAVRAYQADTIGTYAATGALDTALERLSRVLARKFGVELLLDSRTLVQGNINTTQVLGKVEFLDAALRKNESHVTIILKKERTGCFRCCACLRLWGAGCRALVE